MPTRRIAVLLAALCLGLGAVAGCGSDNSSGGSNSSDSGSSGSSSSGSQGKEIKVGLVTDIGGLQDRSFNQLANEGVQRAGKQLGVQVRVLTSKSNGDYVPNLSTLAQQGYDLVIGVGFLMADAVDTVATKFPKTKFAVIDVDQTTLKHKPTNVQGLIFKEQESGYLAGYLAGLYVKGKGGKPMVSAVGGQNVPAVVKYIAGYQAGAKKADPKISVPFGYSQDFVDQAKCKELALNQIAQGSQVVFAAAGQCGLGAIDAAKEKGVKAVGVDADQAYLGPQMLTSAIKKVDVAVFNTVKSVQDGSYQGGGNTVFDLQNGGTGIGKVSPDGQKYVSQVQALSKKVAAGKVDIPTQPTK